MECRRILVPVDGTEYAEQAAKLAYELARQCGARVLLLHVVNLAGVSPVVDRAGRSLLECAIAAGESVLERMLSLAPPDVEAEARCVNGEASETIVEAALEEKASHIVMGSRGLGAVRAAIVGSVSAYVLAHAHCPVTVVKLRA